MSNEPLSLRTVLKFFAITAGLIVLGGYLVFQARFLIIGPRIVLTTDPPQHTNERRVLLTGQTYNISHLWLNDRTIFTNANGYFEEALILENGYTVATLRAEDRYGRTTTVRQSFVYTPASFIE
jgi:hypothetical protein